ncbi:MAG: TonB-dependent receptor [Alistipes sp.]|nr:TonB-dependent receptor [Alistipes sp.]
MMKRLVKISLSLAVVLMPWVAGAQVAKQVEVTKAYVPEIAEAVKLPIEPNMVDTVKMHPEIDYSISPRMYSTSLSTHNFKPATVTYWEYNNPKNFYLKVGAGFPLSSVGDVYASVHRERVGYLLAYLNHDGMYAKLPNYAKVKTKAMQMQNRVGAAGGLYCGKHIFEGDVNYNSEMFHRYAGDGSEIDFEDVNVKLRFGDTFTDLSRLNFDIALHGNYFNDKAGWLAENQRRLQEAHAGAKARIAREFKRHYLELAVGYDGRWGFKDLAQYADNMIYGGLRYGYRSDLLELLVGVDYCYDRVKGRDKSSHYLLPELKVRFNVSRRDIITPFVEVDTSIENNSFHSLIQRNPYVEFIERQFTLPNTVNYDIRFGIEGKFAKDKFAYRLYAGMSFIDNSIYWYNYDYMWLRPEADRRNVMSLNLEVDYKPINRLVISAGVHGYDVNDLADIHLAGTKIALKGGRAPVDGYLKVRYDFGKVSIGASADFYGKAKWSSIERIDPEQAAEPANMKVCTLVAPFYANVNLDVDWQVAKHCTLFLEGRNLANMNIYRWAWYRELGIHFMAGARVSF